MIQSEPLLSTQVLGPDNRSSIEDLSVFLRSLYGESHPYSDHLSPATLIRLMNRGLISVVARLDGELVAHLGFCVRPGQTGQLVFPAFSPAIQGYELFVGQRLEEIVIRLAARHQLQYLLSLDIPPTPGLGIAPVLSVRCLASAFAPFSIRNQNFPVVVRIRSFAKSPSAPIYASEEHHPFVSGLVSQLGLRRQVCLTPRHIIGRVSGEPVISRRRLLRFGWEEFQLSPSSFARSPKMLPSSALVRLPASDTFAPEAISQLEEQGFRFTGLLFGLAPYDEYVLCHASKVTDTSSQSVTDIQADLLVKYAKGYGSARASEPLPVAV